MDSVSFLQQQINEITLQISQLSDKRATLQAELAFQKEFAMLQEYNLRSEDDQV